MSKKLSYRGTINIGEQDRIKLATINGKTGYKINKLQIISTQPGGADSEFIAQVTKTDKTGSITTDVNFTDSTLLAVCYHKSDQSSSQGVTDDVIIFDNEKFNQDIFINITDKSGATVACNYYIELEAMPINDLEATMLTLKSIRNITS